MNHLADNESDRAISLHIDRLIDCLHVVEYQQLEIASVAVCRAASPHLSSRRTFLQLVDLLGDYVGFLDYWRLVLVSRITYNRLDPLQSYCGATYPAPWSISIETESSDGDAYNAEVIDDWMPHQQYNPTYDDSVMLQQYSPAHPATATPSTPLTAADEDNHARTRDNDSRSEREEAVSTPPPKRHRLVVKTPQPPGTQ